MAFVLLLVVPLAACSSDDAPAPSVVEGSSTVASGAPCAPPSPLPSPPAVPQGLRLPAGAVVTADVSTPTEVVLTGRVPATTREVLDHFRMDLERAGFVLQRDEDEGRAGQLGFFGARADGSVVVARLTCPRGETGFTLRVRGG